MVLGIIGGALIGLAAVWLYLSLGRIAGISGIAATALLNAKQAGWQVLFVVGLGLGGWAAYAFIGERPSVSVDASLAGVLVLAGLFVGFGTRLGSGCTSGHGVCGMARLSVRSLASTAVYLCVGMIVATSVSIVVSML